MPLRYCTEEITCIEFLAIRTQVDVPGPPDGHRNIFDVGWEHDILEPDSMEDVWEELAENLTLREPWKYYKETHDTKKKYTAEDYAKEYTAKDLESYYYYKGGRKDGLAVDNERDLRHHYHDLERSTKDSSVKLGMPAGPHVTFSSDITNGFRLVETPYGPELFPILGPQTQSNTMLNE